MTPTLVVGDWKHFAFNEMLGTHHKLITEQSDYTPLSAIPSFLLSLGMIASPLPELSLSVGLFTVLFPQLRSLYIESRNHLVYAPPPFKVLTEIKNFIESSAPGLQMKVNLKRPGRIWIYPNGYRKATLAVFSGFVILWKTDREAAEAVLLHEIAHYRRGDALFMGPGSFIENALKITLLFYALFLILPTAVLPITVTSDVFIDATQNSEITVQKMFAVALTVIDAISLYMDDLLSLPVFYLVKISVFLLPLLGMWSAELNADHVVASHPGYKKGLLRELSKKNGKLVWWRWILFRLSHPPESLRRFFLRYSESYVFSFLLLMFPAAFLVTCAINYGWFLFLHSVGTMPFLGVTKSIQQLSLQELIEPIRFMITSLVYDWLLITLLLLVWPFTVYPWERFFARSHEPRAHNASNEASSPEVALSNIIPRISPRFKYYALAAAFTSTVFLVALIWRR